MNPARKYEKLSLLEGILTPIENPDSEHENPVTDSLEGLLFVFLITITLLFAILNLNLHFTLY